MSWIWKIISNIRSVKQRPLQFSIEYNENSFHIQRKLQWISILHILLSRKQIKQKLHQTD